MTRDHVLSKCIVHSAPPGATLVFENLTNIRETRDHGRRQSQQERPEQAQAASLDVRATLRLHRYKAQERGIHVERIDPRRTSQTWSNCGHQARTNRRSQRIFHGSSCGYELNADLNADLFEFVSGIFAHMFLPSLSRAWTSSCTRTTLAPLSRDYATP